MLDWIENHGEAFLSKHTGVGKSLHRARALQKRHEDFEEVAQVGPRLPPPPWPQLGLEASFVRMYVLSWSQWLLEVRNNPLVSTTLAGLLGFCSYGT